MGCFSLHFIEQIFIWAVVLVAVFAILNLLVPYVLKAAGGVLGEGLNIIIAAVKIVFWAVVAIVVIVVCFELISCLISSVGGLSLPRIH